MKDQSGFTIPGYPSGVNVGSRGHEKSSVVVTPRHGGHRALWVKKRDHS